MLGVSGATYGSNYTPPVTSGRSLLREGGVAESDTFRPGEAPAGIYSRPRLTRPPAPSAPRKTAWAAVTGVLASVFSTGGRGSVADLLETK